MPSANKLKSCGRRRACWHETHCDLLYRASIPESQAYDHNRAYELIAKIKSVKPLARGKLQCISDALKLKRSSAFASHPPRKLYLFRDIQRFYSFADNPTILILGCYDPERKNRSYEYFKMDQKSVKELCDLINRAHNHPLCILLEDENSMIRYHSSHSSLTGDSEHLSSQVETHEETEAKTDAFISPVNSTGDLVNNADDLLTSVVPVKNASNFAMPTYSETREADDADEDGAAAATAMEESLCEELKYENGAQPMGNHVGCTNSIPLHLRSDPLFESLCEHVREEELWAVDLKYVDAHPQRGNEITTRGATYLFVAHHKFPEYHKPGHALDDIYTSEADTCGNTAEVSFTTTFVDQ